MTAAGYDKKIAAARKAIESPEKSTVWKGYHDYQSLYMKGVLDANRSLQIEALAGLIEASGKLGLDPSRYENALRSLKPASIATNRPAPRPVAASTSAKTVEEESGKRRRLVSAKIDEGTLKLRFSAPVPKKGLRRFVLERKGYRLYVFDIEPVRLPFSIRRFKGSGFKEIRIAQYDPRKVRVVIETKKSYKPGLSFTQKGIDITLPGAKKASEKRKKPTPSPQKASSPKAVSSVSAPSLPASTLRRYTVVIDPGHGGRDAGAVGSMRRKEKDAVLAVAKELKKVLQKRGYRVYLTRERDVFVPLKRRTRLANRKQADFFISIHANAAANKSQWLKSRGIETYFLSRARTKRAKRVAAIENSAEIKNVDRYTKEAYLSVLNREKIIESNKLAIDLQRQMLTSVRSRYKDVVDNGVREGPFWVLVGAQMPAVLIEIGYITNPTEAKRLFSARYRKLLAEGIANGIESYIYHNK